MAPPPPLLAYGAGPGSDAAIIRLVARRCAPPSALGQDGGSRDLRRRVEEGTSRVSGHRCWTSQVDAQHSRRFRAGTRPRRSFQPSACWAMSRRKEVAPGARPKQRRLRCRLGTVRPRSGSRSSRASRCRVGDHRRGALLLGLSEGSRPRPPSAPAGCSGRVCSRARRAGHVAVPGLREHGHEHGIDADHRFAGPAHVVWGVLDAHQLRRPRPGAHVHMRRFS